MHPMLNMAIRAAREAGTLITRALAHGKVLRIENKAQHDFVTDLDRASEAKIIEILKKAYPHHNFLGEESGAQRQNAGYEWIIDPIDGTTNFIHGHPYFSISIALRFEEHIEQAVVYDPLREELFTATRGSGAFLNDRRIRVTNASLEGGLLGTGFPFRYHEHLDAYLNTFKALFPYASDVRRAGSAALDLSYVAAGRLDGFWEIGLQPWDMAAGVLLIQEAGGMVCDFGGGNEYFKTGNIIGGNPKILKAIQTTIQPYLSAQLQK